MPFLEVRFPTNISLGAVGGQGWSTRIVETDSGKEFRQQMWDRTRGAWHVGHNLRKQDEYLQLIGFHRLMNGRTFGFRFQDWTDYQDNGVGVLILNTKGNLQLAKAYQAINVLTSDTYVNYRLISKPQPGTVAFSPGSGVTVDYTTGLVTGAPPPIPPAIASTTTWTGQFDVPARFDIDKPEISMDLPTAAGWRGIPIVEVMVPDQ